MVYIDSERCIGCGACVKACPHDAIWLVRDETKSYAEIDQTRCQQCEACVPACPQSAIQVTTEPATKKELVLTEPEYVSVKTSFRDPQPMRPAVKALAWVGPVLGFLSREIVPRVATSLLDMWDRRASQPSPQPRERGDWMVQRPAQQYTRGSGGGGGHRHRWRSGRSGS